ncbi:MAG: hypothetical protein R3E82_17800 [Pseudomonadales bacterium]|nr:hypothetical protein [Pseudomonadales bacterium]
MNGPGLWLRGTGVGVLILCLLWYVPGADSTAQRLWLPLLMAAGTWALTRNLAAVALGGTMLAAIHSDLQATQWIDRLAYPLLALLGALILAVILLRRFRARIAATHDARWANRPGRQDATVDKGTGSGPPQ